MTKKLHFWGAMRECNEAEKSRPPKAHVRNFNLRAQFRGERGKEWLFFKVKKRRTLHRRLIFGYATQFWIIYRSTWKGTFFAIFALSALLLPPNLIITEFSPTVILIHIPIYRICSQTEPSDRITVILVSIEQSKWVHSLRNKK